MDFALIDCNSTINSNQYYLIKFIEKGLKRTVNHRVAGSSPAWGASYISHLRGFEWLIYLPKKVQQSATSNYT